MAKETKTTNESEEKLMTIVATLPFIGTVIYYAMPEAAPMVKHYAKQSIALTAISVANIVIGIVGTFLSFIGIGFLCICLSSLLTLVVFVMWIMLLVNALNGTKYELPVLSEYVNKYVK